MQVHLPADHAYWPLSALMVSFIINSARAGDPGHRPGICQKVGRLRKGLGKGHNKPQVNWLLWWVLSVFTMKVHPCGDEDSEWSALMAEYVDTYCNLIEFIWIYIVVEYIHSIILIWFPWINVIYTDGIEYFHVRSSVWRIAQILIFVPFISKGCLIFGLRVEMK